MDLTIIVCTNEVPKIPTHLKIHPIIIVSPTKPTTILDHKWVKDDFSGLANARNMGLKYVKTKYVLYIADETILSKDIIRAIKYIEDQKWIAACFKTRTYKSNKTYIESANDIRYYKRFKTGEANVIGTPWIWETKTLKKYGFRKQFGYCDDTDICERVKADGHKIGFLPYYCYEDIDSEKLKARFLMYGKGDFQYYFNHKNEMKPIRRLRSFLHCLVELRFWPLSYIPFSIYITLLRFKGFIKARQAL